ncbi:MAG: glycerol-3-phosphate 1-O-acyltransferase PlsY [Christensenellaceae bacterium]|nr:glycerol-3-phosphate 1-O-acyltransferase PlsY [Christensenellaceae bacterium]
MDVLAYIVIAVISYLMGSISSGLLVSKALNGPNLREVGSKNTGASNALRTMGVKAGFATFVGDIIKALIPCVIGRVWMGLPGAMVAGVFVILGHNWPVFFQFKGGKGVSSMTAVMLVSFWWQAIICYVVTIAVIAAFRFISLGSMVMVTLFAILVAVSSWGNWPAIIWAVALAAICIWRHRANIGRLLSGTEAKIGQKVK